jgi:hypothetical protein
VLPSFPTIPPHMARNGHPYPRVGGGSPPWTWPGSDMYIHIS